LLLDGAWLLDLFHEIVIPVSLDCYMGGCPKQHGFYQVMIEIDIEARLSKLIQHGYGRSAFNEPGFKICGRLVPEGAAPPHQVSMATNEMGTGVSIGLRVNE